MLPNQQYDGIPSGNPMPPWTPQVWTKSPEELIAEARVALFQERADVETKALGPSNGAPAMAGGTNQGANESEYNIDPTKPPDAAKKGRRALWEDTVRDLYATEPLAATPAKGDSWSPTAQAPNPAP